MKIYLDSVRLDEIVEALARGFVAGLTSNPTFLRREAGSNAWPHLRRVVELVRPTGLPINVQVMTPDPAAMADQAELIRQELDYPHLVVKVPCGWEELRVIAELARRGFAINCTACMTAVQAVMAAAAGATAVSLFHGKMTDAGVDAGAMIARTAGSLRREGSRCQLMVASIRKMYDVYECMESGADAVTVTYDFMSRLAGHHMTQFAVAQFAADIPPAASAEDAELAVSRPAARA